MPLGAVALKESLQQLPLGQGAQPGSQSVRSSQLPLQRQQRPTPYRIAAAAAAAAVAAAYFIQQLWGEGK